MILHYVDERPRNPKMILIHLTLRLANCISKIFQQENIPEN
jgi:hypothetical protein